MAYINRKKILQLVLSAGGSESSTLITTTTDATLVSGSTYELALTYLAETPKANDFIVYVDSGALTTLYKVTAVDNTKATLTKIGDIGGGSTVVANPTLAGTESDLTGIEIDGTKYKVGGGSQLYRHDIMLYKMSDNFNVVLTIISDRATAYDTTALWQYIKNAGGYVKANGFLCQASNNFIISAFKWDAQNDRPRIYGLQNNTSLTIYYYSGWNDASIEAYTPTAL